MSLKLHAILTKDHPILRLKAKKVPLKEITGSAIQRLIQEMSAVLAEQTDGVALAAPQIGFSLRIFIISGAVLHALKTKENIALIKKQKHKDLIFINPEIIKLSKGSLWVEEGCLSIRYLYGQIKRANKATVKAYDEHGKPFERGASGLMAQIFQHETDHLDGILFTDLAKEIENLPPL